MSMQRPGWRFWMSSEPGFSSELTPAPPLSLAKSLLPPGSFDSAWRDRLLRTTRRRGPHAHRRLALQPLKPRRSRVGEAEQRACAPAGAVAQPSDDAEQAFAPVALDECGRDRDAEHAAVS